MSNNALLSTNPFKTLAISLSGGGFRATAFHLGTLTYLSTKKWQDKTLLERIMVLSTVSGGTLTGIKYAATIKKGGTIEQCYKELYAFMQTDLVGEALDYLREDENWKDGRQRSLITSFAAMYHKNLVESDFALLWETQPSIHLKEMSFNATEFRNGLPFRFQRTEKSFNGKIFDYGFVGNYKLRVPHEVVGEIRLADIVAASSCFPLGFEPINFPDDFIHDEKSKLNSWKKSEDAFGLMDGGVDDNQGIEAITLAEARMLNYEQPMKNELEFNGEKAIDLYIISDVASVDIENFVNTEPKHISTVGSWKLRTFGLVSVLLLLLSELAFCGAYANWGLWWTMVLSTLGTFLLLCSGVAFFLSKGLVGLAKRMGVPEFFINKLDTFDRLNLDTVVNMITNRFKSGKILLMDAMSKQERRSGYAMLYDNELWRPRLIMNAIYELTCKSITQRSNDINKPTTGYKLRAEILQPSQEIIDVSEKASAMGTTLWFTDDMNRDNMLNTLIACGQYNICFNLLDFIEKCRQNPEYTTIYKQDTVAEMDELYNQMMGDWENFKRDPYWMVRECNNI